MTTPNASGSRAASLDLNALRRGDPEALAMAYQRHAGEIHRTLTGFLGDPTEAEDVLHDLFVGLPEALRRYEERGVFGAWLRRVALRMALQRLRKERSRLEVRAESLAPIGQRARAEGLADQLAVHRALAELPEGQRTVVVLRELEGWPHSEIAAFLGLRVGAVMTRHCRAMQRLRILLEGDR
jgi:RNA polymerase sigma-70 factor (ECF subfamily)